MSNRHPKKSGGKSSKPGRDQSHSTIAQHKRQGKLLVPPLATVPGLALRSWPNDRLPELLWGGLLISQLGRHKALGAMRSFIQYVGDHPPGRPFDATLSAIATLPDVQRDELLKHLCRKDEVRQALVPLLLLHGLPALDTWRACLGAEPEQEDWKHLAHATALLLGHQSQEATDCRWVKVTCMVVSGFLQLPSKEMLQELFGYPGYGEQRKVRPSIRAMENSLNDMDPASNDWSSRFWSECQTRTPCLPWPADPAPPATASSTVVERIRLAKAHLIARCAASRSTTAVDAKHDAAFGMCLYSLRVAAELAEIGGGTAALGRMALRTLTEVFITLAYLAQKNSSEGWASYRNYGAGQAKLALLKLDESARPPTFVERETLEALANEDLWQEFQTVNIGQWDNSNLRSMSETAGVKEVYDRFYAWTSAFVHGQWAAVRDTVFQTCANPLHRLHRIPLDGNRRQNDVIDDASYLVDRTLGVLGVRIRSANRVHEPGGSSAG